MVIKKNLSLSPNHNKTKVDRLQQLYDINLCRTNARHNLITSSQSL